MIESTIIKAVTDTLSLEEMEQIVALKKGEIKPVRMTKREEWKQRVKREIASKMYKVSN